MEGHDAADPPLRTLNVFYQGTNVEMLEETYFIPCVDILM